jgi:protein-tyrosine phosphatase
MTKEAFEIFELSGFADGRLALCRQPDGETEYKVIDQWKPSIVVTLTHETEFSTTSPFLPQRFTEADYDWLHLPIVDFGVPNHNEKNLWNETLKQLVDILKQDGRILVHCKGGQGRSGMLLLKLLVLQGESGEVALKRIRDIRPNAVETDTQYAWATKAL